jgi:hypothetical protein
MISLLKYSDSFSSLWNIPCNENNETLTKLPINYIYILSQTIYISVRTIIEISCKAMPKLPINSIYILNKTIYTSVQLITGNQIIYNSR